MSVTMMAIAGKGSFCRYGTRAWYCDALAETLRRKDDLLSVSSTMTDEGGECAMFDANYER
jgi:hypothetical protein